MKLNENAAGDIWLQVDGCLKAKMENHQQAKNDALEIKRRFNAAPELAEALRQLLAMVNATRKFACVEMLEAHNALKNYDKTNKTS